MTFSYAPTGVAVSFALLAALWGVACAVLTTLWVRRGRPPGFGVWPVHSALVALGLALLVLRGAIPESVSVMVGNGALAAGAILGLQGIHALTGGKSGHSWPWLGLALLLGWLALFYWIHPDLSLRILGVTVFLGWILSLALLALRGNPRSRGSRALRILEGATLLFGGVLLLQAFMVVLLAPQEFFYPAAHRWVVLAGVLLFSITLVVALVTTLGRSGASPPR
ncbi:MAG: hypothetical protein ACYC6F_02565 [Longimicrobiales bacterium]